MATVLECAGITNHCLLSGIQIYRGALLPLCVWQHLVLHKATTKDSALRRRFSEHENLTYQALARGPKERAVQKSMCRCSYLLGDVGLEHCHAQHATEIN